MISNRYFLQLIFIIIQGITFSFNCIAMEHIDNSDGDNKFGRNIASSFFTFFSENIEDISISKSPVFLSLTNDDDSFNTSDTFDVFTIQKEQNLCIMYVPSEFRDAFRNILKILNDDFKKEFSDEEKTRISQQYKNILATIRFSGVHDTVVNSEEGKFTVPLNTLEHPQLNKFFLVGIAQLSS